MKGIRALWTLALLSLAVPAVADVLPPEPQVIEAHPALWKVHGRGGSVAYLFGSIHLIPNNIDWRSAEVVRAMQRSDTFAFEVMLNDETEHAVAAYIKNHGTLAPGMSLRRMLSPAAQVDYDAALTQTGLRLEDIDSMRPWYASITLDVSDMVRRNFDPGGVDKQIFVWANNRNLYIRSFETVQQQLAMLAPDGPKLEIEAFELELKDLKDAANAVTPLVDAWSRGDVDTINRITSGEMRNYPHVQKAVFTDRNKRWAKVIGAWLSEKPSTYFICVGAAHLAGDKGVPALLRKAGYQVDGP